MDVIERARLYVGKMDAAISGSGGHTATFKVACALVHGFGLTQTEAWPLMLDYNLRCSPAWSHKDLVHKLKQAEKVPHKEPRGHLRGEWLTRDRQPWTEGGRSQDSAGASPHHDESERDERNWREFDRGALDGEQTAAKVNEEWLWKRSPVDCRSMAAGTFLTHVSEPGDRLICFTNERSQGQFIFWNHAEERRRGWYRLNERRGIAAVWTSPAAETPVELRSARMGVWWLCQPVTGEWKPNGEKYSRRSEGNVAAWRTMVIESDEAGIEQEWLNLLVQMPLRIVAMYTSGGRSVHALVRVNMPSKQAWDQLRDFLKPVLTRLGADKGVFSAVRLTRLPGCLRQGGMGPEGRYVRYAEPRLQRLIFLNPRADGTPIVGLPVLRNEPMWEEAYV